jgi:hypothetical protein
MTIAMHRVHGAPIYEQTLGFADAMLLLLLKGDETEGGTGSDSSLGDLTFVELATNAA